MIVADTSVLIDHLRGRQAATDALDRVLAAGERVVASQLCKIEIMAGMRSDERPPVARLISAMDWIAVDDDVADEAGRLARNFRRSHPGVDVVDYVVAATARLLDAQLWTRNLKHFPMISGLEPPYPT